MLYIELMGSDYRIIALSQNDGYSEVFSKVYDRAWPGHIYPPLIDLSQVAIIFQFQEG